MTAADLEVHDAARRRVRSVLELESTAEFSAVHGDFGPRNILWSRDGAPALIDTDHAAWADPAIDVAPLLGFYSREALAADLPVPLLERASAHGRILSLQVAAAAQLRGDRQLRDHALANFTRRIRSGDPQWWGPAAERPQGSGTWCGALADLGRITRAAKRPREIDRSGRRYARCHAAQQLRP